MPNDKTENTKKEESKYTAYFDGKREWNERFGSYVKQAFVWKIITFISILIALVSTIGLAYMGSQNKLIPYIVQVDKLGNSVVSGPAQQATYNDPKVIKYSLAEFVSNFKTIYGDPVVQKDTVLKTYRYLSPSYPAFNIVNNYFKENSPFERLDSEIVNVKIDSIVPINENTWQIDWHENIFDKKGNKLRTDNYRASATVLIVPPKSESDILKNPIGLYITEFNFSKIIK